MNRTATTQDNGDIKSSFPQQQENLAYTYEGSYAMYSSSSSTPSSVNQPLPGQPPLPPMPPPPGALPPLPHVFGPVPSQVTSIQAWAHPPPPPWQWITPQATSLQSQNQREMTNNAYQRDAVARNNYARRDRYNHNRNNVYAQRNNFHRNKNRRPQRFEQQAQGQQFDPTAYFGQALTGGISIDWQRTNLAAAQNEALINHMAASIPGHQMTSTAPRVATARTEDDGGDHGIKIISEVSLKKNKQRKPMSQNYPSRPWNREDAENALQIENEYNKTIRAQSLIIKFPDPDLNKDIVREFHSGIQNIHFQSPSGPRYCFIQMAENVNIDKAIKELEKIPFGVGNLKVERKSLRDEDNPMPEEIDPYTLYVGNLPESVNVNEVKSKFPTAARVDVGYAQKMRNTRYAFIRYTNVEESIAAYKQAHDLMWDTRSIIVRFRRQRGNTCLPGEPKNNCKKLKEEPSSEQVKNERGNCVKSSKGKQISRTLSSVSTEGAEETTETSTTKPLSVTSTPATQTEVVQPQTKQNWRSQQAQTPAIAEVPTAMPDKEPLPQTVMIADIKEEPQDYDDMEMSYMQMEDDDDDDDDDEEEEDDDDDDEDEDDMVREEDIDDIENDNIEEDDDDEDDMLSDDRLARRSDKGLKDSDAPDALDQMFGELENSIACDIEL